MFYYHCGKKSIKDNAKYCSSCGKSLNLTQGVGNIAESSVSVSPPDSENMGLGSGLNEPGSQSQK